MYKQKISSLPGVKLDDLYKLILVNNGTILEVNEITYFEFRTRSISSLVTFFNAKEKIKKEPQSVLNDKKTLVKVAISLEDRNMHEILSNAGGQWNPVDQTWTIGLDTACQLGLQSNIIHP